MAERFASKKNLTSREASIIDAPLFFVKDILPSNQSADKVLVLDSRGRVNAIPRSALNTGGSGGTYSGSVELSVVTDSGTLVRDIPDESLSLLGGSNISTGVVGSASVIVLDNNISLTSIQLQQDVSTTEALVIKNTSGQTQIRINQEGVLQLAPKEVAPTAVEGGFYYQSGSGVGEAFFIGVSD